MEAHDAARVPTLHAAGISKRWGENRVLDDAELSIAGGEVVALVGKNGVGKTTLLRIAAGVLAPDVGRIRVLGLDPAADRREFQRRIGYLSAGSVGLWARLTAEQNLELWAAFALLRRARRRTAIAASLELFGLSELARQRVDRMSMGQRQRVRLAMAFLHDPALVILDEPANSLDEDALELIGNALEGLVARGGGALWCAPVPPDAPQVTRLCALEAGRVVAR